MFRLPTDLERAFLRVVTAGYSELHQQIESCLVADYDPDGFCDVLVLHGPPSRRPASQSMGPSLVTNVPGSPLVDSILWIDARGFLAKVEIVEYGDAIGDIYRRFVNAAAGRELRYNLDSV